MVLNVKIKTKVTLKRLLCEVFFQLKTLEGKRKNIVPPVDLHRKRNQVPLLVSLLLQAVCCPDRIHCCPANYRCDPQSTSCISGDASLSWFSKIPATFQTAADHQDVKCDDKASCPDGQTCCRMSPSTWGCCPSPNVQ